MIGDTLGNDETDLHALKGKDKGKGFKGQCYHCRQYGHRVSAERRTLNMMKEKGRHKGFSKGKNAPQQQMLHGKCEGGYGSDFTWSDPWANSWTDKSGVRSVEEQYEWQSEDGTTLFGLEVRTSIKEEAQNKGVDIAV